MNTNRRMRTSVALCLAGTLAFSQPACGILLHPTRAEGPRGQLDVVVVAIDCAWLLVGVVPGVVALAIDFASGGAWHPKGEVSVAPGEQIRLNINGPAPAACEISLRVVDASGRDLAPETRVSVAEGGCADCIAIAIPADAPSGAALLLAIDGREQSRWTVARTE